MHEGVPHEDETVKISLGVSCVAVCVSLFNFIMFKANDFDPILLQIELKQRIERNKEKQRISFIPRRKSIEVKKIELTNLIQFVRRISLFGE